MHRLKVHNEMKKDDWKNRNSMTGGERKRENDEDVTSLLWSVSSINRQKKINVYVL